jgi:hypothetical protein
MRIMSKTYVGVKKFTCFVWDKFRPHVFYFDQKESVIHVYYHYFNHSETAS